MSLGFGAVVGPEAPLIAIGGGLAAATVRLARRGAPAQTLAVVAAAGSFAAISALLGSPLAGAFLLMEAAGIGGAMLRADPAARAGGLGHRHAGVHRPGRLDRLRHVPSRPAGPAAVRPTRHRPVRLGPRHRRRRRRPRRRRPSDRRAPAAPRRTAPPRRHPADRARRRRPGHRLRPGHRSRRRRRPVLRRGRAACGGLVPARTTPSVRSSSCWSSSRWPTRARWSPSAAGRRSRQSSSARSAGSRCRTCPACRWCPRSRWGWAQPARRCCSCRSPPCWWRP